MQLPDIINTIEALDPNDFDRWIETIESIKAEIIDFEGHEWGMVFAFLNSACERMDRHRTVSVGQVLDKSTENAQKIKDSILNALRGLV